MKNRTRASFFVSLFVCAAAIAACDHEPQDAGESTVQEATSAGAEDPAAVPIPPPPPGPFRCKSNADCPATSFCRAPLFTCGGGTCAPRPRLCPLVRIPVCGCDRRTYGNQCEAARAGVNVLHPGVCRFTADAGEEDTARPVPPFPPGPRTCGNTTCPQGQVCCNASCGICTPPGGACIQVFCEATK